MGFKGAGDMLTEEEIKEIRNHYCSERADALCDMALAHLNASKQEPPVMRYIKLQQPSEQRTSSHDHNNHHNQGEQK